MRGRNFGRGVIALAIAGAGIAYAVSRRPRAAEAPPRPAILSARLPAPPPEIPVGAALPSLALADDGGRKVSLASFQGAPTVLLFFRASSCPVCRAQLTAFAQVASRFAAAGLRVVAASPDAPPALAELRRELGLSMRLLSDPDEQAVNALCGGLSHCELLADAQGIIRWGAFAESWSHAPGPEALLGAVRPLTLSDGP